ncbi:hypothetical protein C8F04DRAFT_1185041 [Mycena alexandri]|uniref:Uncharacterized protein n=1 Tax=Mycena alexandri TaxID=1745969 RepID=A0AAD6SRN0_9AGAR|nr:hypothetical protein C8F04DRAFT_1185041 [Mycena alexandri]
MDSKDRPLFKSPRAIRHWMAQNEDSPMEPVGWDDSAQYIEDRNHQGASQYFRREARSRWAGDLPRPTFVYGVNAPLGGPIPRFGGFGVVENYPGDNPGHTKIRTGASGTQEEGTSFERGVGGYVQNRRSGSVTTSSSEDSRRFEGNSGHDEELRQRAMTSRDRERFADKPYWENGQRIRADTRRHPYNNYESGARTRGFSSTEHAYNRNARVPPPPPTLRQARTGLPDPTRTIDNPDLNLAPRGPDGHPQSEWAVRQASSSTIEHDDCPPPDPSYAAAEEERIARTREKPLAAGNISQPAWREGNPRLLGRFYRCQIHSIEQAYNLISFLDAGQQEAFELYSIIVGNLAAYPRTFRTEGEAHLMRFQQDIDRAWWITTTGVPRPPRHERHPNLYKSPRATAVGSTRGREHIAGPSTTRVSPEGAPRNYGPRTNVGTARMDAETVPDAAAPSGYGLTYTFGTAAAVHPTPSTAAIVTPDTAPIATGAEERGYLALTYDTTQGYLGRSAPNVEDARPAAAGDSDSGTTVNTRWTAGELVLRYQRTHPGVWARGIRGANGRMASAMGDSPNVSDVLAHHTTTALAPNERRTNSHQNRLFVNAVTRLFSVEGLYEIILRVGEYPLADKPLEHYPYPTDNITIFLVAAWYAQHGIVPDSTDVGYLEEYARTRRNVTSGLTDLTNSVWDGSTTNAAMLQNVATQVPHRNVLQHAPVPSAGIGASVHAPMDGVQSGTGVQTTAPQNAPEGPKTEGGQTPEGGNE